MKAIQRICGHTAFVLGSQGVVYPFITLLFSVALILLGLPAISGAQQACMPDGDVDQNGTVTAADALLVFQQALGLPRLSMCQQSIADVFPQPTSSDGSITVSDALCVLRAALTLPSCLDNMQPSNQPPVVSAQADPSSAEAGTIVILSASARDPDGAVPEYLADASSDTDDTIANYRWEQTDGPTVALAGSNSPTAMFTAPHVTATESLTFRITVSDHEGALGRNMVSVTVTTSDNSGIISGTLIVGEGSFSDGDTKDIFDPVLENNSLQGQRIPLTLPYTVTGHVNHIDDEVDVYHVTLPALTYIELKTGDWPDADLDLYLADTTGEIIDASIGYERFEVIGIDSLPEEGFSGVIPEEFFDMVEEDLPGAVEEDLRGMGQEDLPGAVEEGFLVMVRAATGASNYVLSLRTHDTVSLGEAYGPGLRLGADFHPDNIIVEFREGLDQVQRNALVSSIAGDVSAIIAGNVQFVEEVVPPSGPILLNFQDTFSDRHSLAELDSPIGDSGIGPLHHATPEDARKARMLHAIKRLGSNPDSLYAEPNFINHALLIPNDPRYIDQWHYPLINLPAAWDITTGSDDIVIAVIDSGVVDHDDLWDRLLYGRGFLTTSGNLIGYDFIRDPESARDGDGIDPDPNDPDVLGSKTKFHGTHVAGTIGAATNNSLGVAGVTWQGKIMPLRVIDPSRSATHYDIAQAILYAARLQNSSNSLPARFADIINLSLGPKGCQHHSLSGVVRGAIERAIESGVHVVVAAGNDNCPLPVPMSRIDGVIAVSAVNRGGEKAWFSNYGPTIDVAAPGTSVLSTSSVLIEDAFHFGIVSGGFFPDFSRYESKNGTSMAAPHVAGVLALMLAVNPDLTPDDVNRLLAGTHPHPGAGPIVRDLGAPGRDDNFGHGLIDAYKAVRTARAMLPKPPRGQPLLSVLTDSLYFPQYVSRIEAKEDYIFVRNVGGGQLYISNVTTDSPWLMVGDFDPELLPSFYPSLVTVRVDRTGLRKGVYSGRVVMTTNGGDRTIPVTMVVEPRIPGGDAGTVYVLAADPDSLEAMAQSVLTSAQGFEYRMPELPAGTYFVIAGTDRDDDGYICDPGEACGAYPDLDSPQPIDLDGDQSGVRFFLYQDLITGRDSSPLVEFLPMGIRRLPRHVDVISR